MSLIGRTKRLSGVQLLAMLLTVDGTGSGLDADLVHGVTPGATGLVALAATTVAANLVLAGPTSGGSAAGSFRALVAADIPNLDTSKLTSGTLGVARGGTGLASFTSGDLPYASGTTTISKLGIGSSGTFLKSNGSVPAWASITISDITSGTLAAANGGTGIASYAVGDILYASAGTTLSKLADVATGNALISGGVTTAPSWGKIGLTTHVSGVLPSANGGTGVNNAGTLTNASNTTVTGGGTIALGGFTLTIPATGTAVLLGTTQTISGAKTFSAQTQVTDTTAATSSITGSLIIGNGTLGTTVGIGAGKVYAGAGFTVIVPSLNNAAIYVGTSAASTQVGITLADNGTDKYILYKGTGNDLTLYDAANTHNVLQYSPGALSAGVVTLACTTASSSTTTGALVVSGGAGIAGALSVGGVLQVYGASSTRFFKINPAVGGGGSEIRLDDNAFVSSILLSNGGITGANQGIAFVMGLGDGGTIRANWNLFLGSAENAWTSTASTQNASVVFQACASGSAVSFLTGRSTRSVSVGGGTLATNATDGFLYVPTCAGTPTGAPTAISGFAPIIVNTTNNKLYFYSGAAWRDAGP